MGKWVDALHARTASLHDQIAALLVAQQNGKHDLTILIDRQRQLLQDEFAENYALAALLDDSDFVIHAEGPKVRHHATETSAVRNLCEIVNAQLLGLGTAALHLSERPKDLRILLNGMAPGSLYMGFSVAGDELGTLLEVESELQTMSTVRKAIDLLPTIPKYIGSETVSNEITEAIDDAALRDAALVTTFKLSPSGKSGIHTIEISTPKSNVASATLSNKERVVLRESAINRPFMRTKKHGAFVGEMREVDIDTGRFQVRSVPSIGTLRCVLSGLSADVARKHLGHGVRVTGDYEQDASGKPRLMIVTSIAPYSEQLTIDESA